MSTIELAATRVAAAGSLPELASGLAVVGLTILGLAGVSPTFLLEIAAVLFCLGPFLGRVAKLSELEPAYCTRPREIGGRGGG